MAQRQRSPYVRVDSSMRSRSGLMTSRQLSWQANAAKPIGQSAYRRLSPHKNNRNRRQRIVEINQQKINENMFIDVICCVMGRKVPDQIRSGLHPGHRTATRWGRQSSLSHLRIIIIANNYNGNKESEGDRGRGNWGHCLVRFAKISAMTRPESEPAYQAWQSH